jgi:TonB family protein
VKVISAQPAGIFDQVAIQAVRQWRYEPPLVNGRPAPFQMKVRLIFEPPHQ